MKEIIAYTNEDLFNLLKKNQITDGVFRVLKSRAVENKLNFNWVLRV
jgi:hypothetical protein